MSIHRKIQQEVLDLIQNCDIRKLCDKFFSEKFLWVVKGSGVLSKTYTDKEVYFNQAFNRLGEVLLPATRC
ncbi:MAG: hypothetical protein GY821_15465 [Gammaproteobacteria bacterium]|nr:hypothetical protein [Gammaproteobacteria bacterium]